MAGSFQYGGQAVIEGVMMRGPARIAVAVRCQEGGIVVEEEEAPPWTSLARVLRLPLVRGMVALLESLVIGIRVLTHSANIAADDAGESLSWAELAVTMVLAVTLAVGLFVVLPTVGAHALSLLGSWGQNLVEGVFRLGVFLAYLVLISRLSDIRRVFEYHGAEHKVIHAYEAGDPLEPAHAAKYPTLHPRCGTSFLLIVLILTIFFFSLIDTPTLGAKIASRILLLPLIAGVGYEMLKFFSRHIDNAVVRGLVAPGLWVQKLTTREPDVSQLEVAISALKAVLPAGELSRVV